MKEPKKIKLNITDYKKTKATLYVFVVLIIVFIYNTLPKKVFDSSLNDSALENVKNNSEKVSPTPTQQPINEKDLIESPGKYIDKKLRFVFNYPPGSDYQKCSDRECIYFGDNFIRVEFLDPYVYGSQSAKEALLGIDLFCKFDTDTISIACHNDQITDYINSQGTKIFILYRTKYIRNSDTGDGGMINGTYHEKIYLIPVNNERYGLAVLLADSPTPENADVLFQMADSFRNI